MKSATKDKITKRIEELRIEGKDFCPANIGHELGTSAGTITQNIRYLPGVVLKKKCNTTRSGYTGSVWGFEKVSGT